MSGVETRLTADSAPILDWAESAHRTEHGGIVEEWATWLTDRWRWDWFFTGTFEDPSEASRRLGHTAVGWALSERRYREWVQQLEARSRIGAVYWFRGREPHKHRATTHFHALIGGVDSLRRDVAWRDWFERNGRARIEPIRSYADVARYVAKYVLKDQGEMTFSANAGLWMKKGADGDARDTDRINREQGFFEGWPGRDLSAGDVPRG